MRCAAEGGLRGVALVAVWVAGLCAVEAWGQVPDNRGLELDPDDLLSPEYGRSLLEGDEQRLRDARERGGSFFPTAHGDVEESEAPAGETGVAQEPVPERPALVGETAPEPVYETYEAPAVESLAVPEMLDALIEAWNAAPAITRVRYPRRERAPGEGEAAASADREGRPAIDAATGVSGLAVVRPGDGVYARAVYAIDSDYPGPVFLEVLEPPLAGARLTGAFTLVGDRLALRLSAIEHRGARAPVDAWAVGLDCACYGVPGAVDRHWVERVLLPAAVRFAEGFLASAGQPEETVSVDGGGTVYERRRSTRHQDVFAGAAAAVGAAGDVLLEGAPAGPTVRIARDAELMVVFAGAGERMAVVEDPSGG